MGGVWMGTSQSPTSTSPSPWPQVTPTQWLWQGGDSNGGHGISLGSGTKGGPWGYGVGEAGPPGLRDTGLWGWEMGVTALYPIGPTESRIGSNGHYSYGTTYLGPLVLRDGV